MTPAEIDALPAGPELDALVSEKVMGEMVTPAEGLVAGLVGARTILRYEDNDIGGVFIKSWKPYPLPPYSTDDAAALAIIKTGLGRGSGASWRLSTACGLWFAEVGFWKPEPTFPLDVFGEGRGEMLALAICRAALKAVKA